MLATTSITPALAQNQGDQIYTKTGPCIIGFVDTLNHRIWTDPNCGPANTEVFADPNHQQPLGTLTAQGYFTLDSDGNNPYSGDRPAVVGKGDELCVLTNQAAINCTVIHEVTPDYLITRNIDGLTVGAPAWIPGKGYVGTATSTSGVYSRHDLALQRTTTPGETPTTTTTDAAITSKTQAEAFGAKLPDAVEFATLPDQIRVAKEELHEAEARATALETRLAELGDPAAIAAQLAATNNEVADQKTELERLKAEETQQTDQLAASTSAVAQLEVDAIAKQAEIDQLKTELSEVNDRIAAKKAEIAQLEAQKPPLFGLIMLLAGIAAALFGFFAPFFNLLAR